MAREPDFDAFVVGAGMGGIYQTYACLQRGLRTRCIDRAHGVGGTWYWNRYPGAMSDTESFLYRFSWDKELLQTYPWPDHYVKQPQILAYLEHVVEKHGLAKAMSLGTELVSAEWDDSGYCWRLETRSVNEQGEPVDDVKRFTTRYLITALGLLSKQNLPDIKGIDRYQGTKVHTGAWPKGLDLSGQRVGVIGCGSTGVQVISALAPKAKRLVCFQRSPQYSVPSGDGPVSQEYRKWVNENYDAIWRQVRDSLFGFGLEESKVPAMSVSEEERRRKFEEAWRKGNGFRFMFWTFNDITTNRESNDAAASFIKEKIRSIVKDPEKARKLLPREIYARRPLCDSGYYQSFNRDSVDIVNLQDTPIAEMTEKGIRTSDGLEYELDAIIFATGFDAVDGNLSHLHIRGRHGKTLKEHFASAGPRSYLGVGCAGFPNLLMITGPQSPFSNVPPVLETQVEFIADAIVRFRQKYGPESKGAIIEVSQEAENAWTDICINLAKNSLFHETASWIFGANIAGKKYGTRFYFAGLRNYIREKNAIVADDYRGFVKHGDSSSVQKGAARSVL